jgi:hypothetical protein
VIEKRVAVDGAQARQPPLEKKISKKALYGDDDDLLFLSMLRLFTFLLEQCSVLTLFSSSCRFFFFMLTQVKNLLSFEDGTKSLRTTQRSSSNINSLLSSSRKTMKKKSIETVDGGNVCTGGGLCTLSLSGDRSNTHFFFI